jgi:glutamine amidotransferase
MCRHLAYLGPVVPLADLLLTPSHSLLRQSWEPADMRGGGTVNADGFGIGWYPPNDEHLDEPVRYRRNIPIWADESLPGIAEVTRSGAVLAAVRNGTTGMALTETACAPFTERRWLFSHNGLVTGWPASVAKLAERLPVTDLLTLDAPTDSALLWALVLDRLRSGDAPADAVTGVLADVVAAAPESRLNLLLTDGEQLVATAWSHSLSVRRTAESVAVSSEPWDTNDETWRPVPDRHVVLATRETLEVHPMEGPL